MPALSAPIASRLSWSAVLVMAGLTLSEGGVARADVAEAARAYQRGDHAAAAAELMPLAHEGDPRAQFLIGRMCFYGQVLVQDVVRAVGWYRRAAEQGYAPAQLAYATALDSGWGLERDRSQALRWYRLAALQGERKAMWRLAFLYRRGLGAERDMPLAWAWFDRLAALGEWQAGGERDWLALVALDENGLATARARSAELERELQIAPLLGQMEWLWGDPKWPGYDRGLAAAQAGDWDRARREWQARAGEGDVTAQLRLARLYDEGRSALADPFLAERWFRRAAEQGHPSAQLSLARLYWAGDRIQPDPVQSLQWLLLALQRLPDGAERAEAEALAAAVEAGLDREGLAEAQRRAEAWLQAR